MTLLRNLDRLPDAWRGGALAIGNYDGVHCGHARIMHRLRTIAREVGGPAVVFTFDPCPAKLLRPDHAPSPLTWTQRKAQLLAELGVDAVVAYPTDLALLSLSAHEFFQKIVVERLDAKAMVEGPNFFFGHRRDGNVELLDQLCRAAGRRLEVVEPVRVDGQIVSSSQIRRAISAGDVVLADRMLGRPHRVRGTVIHGAGRGVSLGFPTANLAGIDLLPPGEGIYAGRTRADDRDWPSAISVGGNPTFGEGQRKVEVYLIGYRGDLYGRTIEVDFLRRLRDIVRYPSVNALLEQLHRDVAETLRT